MRTFNPVYLAAAVAIALSGPFALAQTTGGAVRTAPTGVTTTTNTSPAERPAASTGSCTGTGGSSCTATTSNSPSTNGTATNSSTTPTPGVFDATTSGTAQSTQATGVGSSAGVSGSAMGTNQTTVDPATTRPGSFAPGGAFGPPGTNAPGTITLPSTLNGTAGGVVIPGDPNMAGNPSQQTIVIQQPPAQPEMKAATPLLDQTTREAQARETRRRNAKQEPRIIGIAPNTDRDLTYQMPDDRIIRY